MIKQAALAVGRATRELFLHWRGVAVVGGLYLLLLTVLYLFIMSKEATKIQVAITVVLSIAAPILFFTFQSAIANIGRDPTAS